MKQVAGREWRGKCPVHNGNDPNFSVRANDGRAHCHSQCGRGWDVISLEQALTNCDFGTAKERVFELIGRDAPSWEERDIEAVYDYQHADGTLAYQVVRRTGKKFIQRRPDDRGGWAWGLGNAKPVPFRLPKVQRSQFVAVVEGEKDVISLEREGWVATCNNGGAKNFKPEITHYFNGKDVAIFPDNDDKGREHALLVAALLAPVAASVKIVEVPSLPLKGDVTDFLNAGGSIEELAGLYYRATLWTPEWTFTRELPDENDRHVRTLAEEIRIAGGMDQFWDFRHRAGVPAPWKKLSFALAGGMRDGEVYVLGGNQGSGKTSLALQFATAALRANHGVLFFSMEMGWRDVFQRMISIEAKVDLLEFGDIQRHGGMVSGLRGMLDMRTREATHHALLVSTRSGVTPEYLRDESIRLRKRQPIQLVIVDHMQLMSAAGSVRGDYEKFTAISRAMKQTAQEIGAPVLLVSQVTRLNSHDRRAELDVSDLRGSGAIEEDAAAVMLLYEDKEDAGRADSEGTYDKGPVKTWVKLGKNRYGSAGTYLPLWHNKRFTRFDPFHQGPSDDPSFAVMDEPGDAIYTKQ